MALVLLSMASIAFHGYHCSRISTGVLGQTTIRSLTDLTVVFRVTTFRSLGVEGKRFDTQPYGPFGNGGKGDDTNATVEAPVSNQIGAATV